MLNLKRNQANQKYLLTLQEALTNQPTAETPTWLMVLKSEQTDEVVSAWIIDQTGIFSSRYNEGLIDTTKDEPTLGNVVLPDVGYYVYAVYYQNSTDNLDPESEDVLFLAEIGRMQVT